MGFYYYFNDQPRLKEAFKAEYGISKYKFIEIFYHITMMDKEDNPFDEKNGWYEYLYNVVSDYQVKSLDDISFEIEQVKFVIDNWE